MKPDEKYMPSNSKNSDDDLNLKPFSTPFPLILPRLDFNQPMNIFTTPNKQLNLNTSNISSDNNKKNNLINNENSEENKKLSEEFPSYNSSDTLYSYNDSNNSNSNNYRSNFNSYMTQPDELLRNLNLDLDEDVDLTRCCKDTDVSRLYKEIEDDCQGILSLLEAYNIPTPIAKLIMKRIIKITLRYCKK